MKQTGWILAASALALTAACSGQGKDKTDTADAGGFDLPYEKFTLKNGLDVVLHVDKSDPIVAFSTVVEVGSNREKPGRTGFAHFFEHMSFNDSENVPRGWNRKAIPEWGGQRNGGTWSDGTIYYEVVPKDAFDKIMWIDSDRLGYMINTVTRDALEREKQVVKNEKRQRVDNAPYGYTQEVIRTALYPEGHPYNWTVIGQLPDLQAATLDDVREFYDQYYGAANATLVIAGDIDIAETRDKVERWFGEIRRGPDVEPLVPMPAGLSETKSLWFEDSFATLPELRVTFPSVESYNADEPALTVLAQLLAGSKNSPVYRTIVDEGKLAPDVSAYNDSMELAGEFVFRVRANAGTDLDDVEAALQAAFARFEADGVDPKDLERIKAEQETILYSQLSTVLGKAIQMSQDDVFSGDPAFRIKAAEMMRAVTAEDVMRAYETYVKGKPAILTSFVPRGSADLALEGAQPASVWIEEVRSDVAAEEVSAGEIAEYANTPSKYDRSEPPFGELPMFTTPDIWEASLDNNIRLLGIETSETPLVNFDITFDSGAWLDAPGKKGTANLLAALMNEGTATRTPAEMEQAIGLIGSGITVSAGADEITISATALSRNFEETVALVQEILASPRFETEDFERVKLASLTAIRGRDADPNAIASLALNRLLYGTGHPHGTTNAGSAESVESIGMEDVKASYDTMLGAGVRIHVAGDVSADRAEAAFAGIAGLVHPTGEPLPDYPIPEQVNAGKVFFIDVPDSKQSVIFAGKLALNSVNPDAARLNFANEKLGGGISGDLAQVLRIEKGYTYGAVSFVSDGRAPQAFRAITSVRANATQASLDIIRNMIADYGPGFTEADAEMTKGKVLKSNTLAYESLGAKLGILDNISKFGFAHDYVEKEQAELVGMTLDDFKSVTAKYLVEPEMTYVIVGDKATQFDAVNEFAGGNLVELDIYGEPVS
ncbi:MAG: insulinase family protein [Hyphomonas sp.]|nr:insulinase family protein [Hyphomonas sp.]